MTVVYVGTENNTVYAIDSDQRRNSRLPETSGAPVPAPFGCNNNGPYIGITEHARHRPVVADHLCHGEPLNGPPTSYQLHALSLIKDLSDKVAPVTVAASHTLTNGVQFALQRHLSASAAGVA